jgi:hypothetical protein
MNLGASVGSIGSVVRSYVATSAQALSLPTTETTKVIGKGKTTHDLNDQDDQTSSFRGGHAMTPESDFPVRVLILSCGGRLRQIRRPTSGCGLLRPKSAVGTAGDRCHSMRSRSIGRSRAAAARTVGTALGSGARRTTTRTGSGSSRRLRRSVGLSRRATARSAASCSRAGSG